MGIKHKWTKIMKKTSINRNWEYSHLGENDWKEITLPHDAMLSEPRGGHVPGGKNTGYFEGRDYSYKRDLVLEKRAGSRYILEFEGVYRNAKVFLNGEEVAFRPYGYTNFYVDITEKARNGANLLEVRAFNSDLPNSRWYSGAGIYRPVWLYELPEKHILINGVKIKTADFSRGEIEVSIETSDGGDAAVEILDWERVVASGNGKNIALIVENAKLWSPETPFLYTCRVRYFEDEQTVSFGIRSIECDAEKGFCINGKRVILCGACIHHDNGILGACAYPEAEERKISLLKEAGYNAIRSAHNPCSKALLDACDRLGMLVLDEYADMWYIHKNKYDYASHLPDRWEQDLTDLVEKDFNHPSVIMYSTGNEVGETSEQRGIELAKTFTDYLHKLDPTRPVTCGINIWFNGMYRMGFGQYSDKKAEKQASAKTGKKPAMGSEFFNNLASKVGAGFMKTMATLPICDRVSRGAFANMDVAGYNYGIKRYRHDFKKYPERVIVGSETFVSDAYDFMELAKKNPALIGDFVWAGIDYLGECGIGAMEYREYAKDFVGGPGWIAAGSGRLDLIGRELGEALYTKVAFGLLPIAVAVVPVKFAKEKHSPTVWGMTNARPSWSWNGCDGKKTRIEVYSRAHTVRLFINSKSIGVKKVKKGKAVFQAKYQNGCVLAIGYDRAKKEICRTSLITAGNATKLTLVPETKRAQKGKLFFVRLQYTDNEGTVKPLARGEIKLRVEGGKLLGFGNACPYNEKGYLSDTSDTYYGEALAVIRPEGETLTLTANSSFGDAALSVPVG